MSLASFSVLVAGAVRPVQVLIVAADAVQTAVRWG